MKKQGILSITGIAILGLIVLMTLHEWDYAAPLITPERPDVPSLILENMQSVRHNADGTRQYSISAEGLSWFEKGNRSELTGPSVEMFSNNANWFVSANQGKMQQEKKVIELNGSVHARRDGPAPLSLKTERLTYYANEERLHIPAKVNVDHVGGNTRAGQLDADLKQGVIKMKGGVETHYVPTSG